MIPRLGRSPEEGNRYPLQYSGLENSMDCPWGCKELSIVHGVTKSQTRLSNFHFHRFKPTSLHNNLVKVRTFITLILQRMKPEAQRGWGVYPKSHSPQVAAPGFKSSQPGPSTAIHSHTDILALKSIVLKCLLHMFTH